MIVSSRGDIGLSWTKLLNIRYVHNVLSPTEAIGLVVFLGAPIVTQARLSSERHRWGVCGEDISPSGIV